MFAVSRASSDSHTSEIRFLADTNSTLHEPLHHPSRGACVPAHNVRVRLLTCTAADTNSSMSQQELYNAELEAKAIYDKEKQYLDEQEAMLQEVREGLDRQAAQEALQEMKECCDVVELQRELQGRQIE